LGRIVARRARSDATMRARRRASVKDTDARARERSRHVADDDDDDDDDDARVCVTREMKLQQCLDEESNEQ
jgi:hypothetical protein